MQYFFVCGAPKSGTTWLQRLFDAHPAVVCSGEGHFIERLANPIAQTFGQYNKHLQLVAERVYEGKPYYPLVDARTFAPLIRAFIIEIMSKRKKPGVLALGDKTPRYTQFLGELRFFFPNARFVHIVRDPRDVAVSRLHHASRAGYPDAFASGSQVHQEMIAGAAKTWLSAQENFTRFMETHPQHCLEVRYEDLSAAPEEVMARSFRFLGVSDADETVAAARDEASFEKWAGRKPGEENKASFFRKGVVGDWRGVLDPAAAEQIGSICGSWIESKGYSIE